MKSFHSTFIFVKSLSKLLTFAAVYFASRKNPGAFAEFVAATSLLGLFGTTLTNSFIIAAIHGKEKPFRFYPSLAILLALGLLPAFFLKSGFFLYIYLVVMYLWDYTEVVLFRTGIKKAFWIFSAQKVAITVLLLLARNLQQLYLAFAAPMLLSLVLVLPDLLQRIPKIGLEIPKSLLEALGVQGLEVFVFNFPPAMYPVIYGRGAMEKVAFLWFLYRTLPYAFHELLRVVSGTFLKELKEVASLLKPAAIAGATTGIFLPSTGMYTLILLAAAAMIKKFVAVESEERIGKFYLPVALSVVAGVATKMIVHFTLIGFAVLLLF